MDGIIKRLSIPLLFAIVISSLLAAISITLTNFQTVVVAQQNATNNTTTTTANQTGGGGQLASFTQADFEPLIDNLASAREALTDQDKQAAYDALSSASNDLFGLLNNQEENRISVLAGQFKPIQTSIDNAQQALRNNDNTKALNSLNTADNELLKITQQLSTEDEDGDGDEGGEAAAPAEDEDEGEEEGAIDLGTL
jgi:hypothetical protein